MKIHFPIYVCKATNSYNVSQPSINIFLLEAIQKISNFILKITLIKVEFDVKISKQKREKTNAQIKTANRFITIPQKKKKKKKKKDL